MRPSVIVFFTPLGNVISSAFSTSGLGDLTTRQGCVEDAYTCSGDIVSGCGAAGIVSFQTPSTSFLESHCWRFHTCSVCK